MAIYPRCADTLPAPLNGALVVKLWECIPPPEKRINNLFASLTQTPTTEIARGDVAALLLAEGYLIPAVRMTAYRANMGISFFNQGGVEYWRVNRQWMVEVFQAQLLGCCQLDQNDCYYKPRD